MTLDALTELPRINLRAQLVKKILKAIFTGDIPAHSRLVEEELAEKLGVSRTPIREALSELAAIGVIHLKPNHGAVVRPFGPDQLREINHIRRLLEAEAARLACGRVNVVALRPLRERHEQLLSKGARGLRWTEQVMAIDQELHELLSVCSGSTRLAEEIGRYRTLIMSIREAVGNTMHALEIALVEHMVIIDRLMEGDGDGAAAAMEQHLKRGTDAAVAALTEAREKAKPPIPGNGNGFGRLSRASRSKARN